MCGFVFPNEPFCVHRAIITESGNKNKEWNYLIVRNEMKTSAGERSEKSYPRYKNFVMRVDALWLGVQSEKNRFKLLCVILYDYVLSVNPLPG